MIPSISQRLVVTYSCRNLLFVLLAHKIESIAFRSISRAVLRKPASREEAWPTSSAPRPLQAVIARLSQLPEAFRN